MNAEAIELARQKSSSLPESTSSDSGGSFQSMSSSANISVKRLHSVITELLETERAYLQDLRELDDGYYIPLRSDPDFDEEILHAIFHMLPRLRDFHEFFCVTLNECQWNLCSIVYQFIHYAPQLEALYTDFCVNLSSALLLIAMIRRERPELAVKLTECQRNVGHKLRLEAYLTKPFQRVLRYQLMLKELLKNGYEAVTTHPGWRTPSAMLPDSQDASITQQIRSSMTAVNQALDKMIKVSNNINEHKKRHEMVTMLQLKNPELSKYGNPLLADEMHLSTKKGSRVMILFEKAVLQCKRIPVGSNSLGLNAKHTDAQPGPGATGDEMTIQRIMELSQIVLTVTTFTHRTAFQLSTFGQPRDAVIIRAPNAQIKDQWCGEIRRLLLEQGGAVIPPHARTLIQQMEVHYSDEAPEDTTHTKTTRSRTRGRSIGRERRKKDKSVVKNGVRSASCVPPNLLPHPPEEDDVPTAVPADRPDLDDGCSALETDEADYDSLYAAPSNKANMISKIMNVVRTKKKSDGSIKMFNPASRPSLPTDSLMTSEPPNNRPNSPSGSSDELTHYENFSVSRTLKKNSRTAKNIPLGELQSQNFPKLTDEMKSVLAARKSCEERELTNRRLELPQISSEKASSEPRVGDQYVRRLSLEKNLTQTKVQQQNGHIERSHSDRASLPDQPPKPPKKPSHLTEIIRQKQPWALHGECAENGHPIRKPQMPTRLDLPGVHDRSRSLSRYHEIPNLSSRMESFQRQGTKIAVSPKQREATELINRCRGRITAAREAFLKQDLLAIDLMGREPHFRSQNDLKQWTASGPNQ